MLVAVLIDGSNLLAELERCHLGFPALKPLIEKLQGKDNLAFARFYGAPPIARQSSAVTATMFTLSKLREAWVAIYAFTSCLDRFQETSRKHTYHLPTGRWPIWRMPVFVIEGKASAFQPFIEHPRVPQILPLDSSGLRHAKSYEMRN